MFRNVRTKIIQKMYDDDGLLNLWAGQGFVMSGLGEKIKIKGLLKHLHKTLKRSKQRATKGYSDIDVWCMCDFLEELFPAMLTELKNTRHGSPGELENLDEADNKAGACHGIDEVSNESDTCHEKWDKILDEMIFLWKEANEKTCSKENKYAEEYHKAQDEFDEKYGFFGEGLYSEKDKEYENKTGNKVIYGIAKAPEYEEIWNKYIEEEKQIAEHRIKCKDRAFDLMKEHFYDLWD